MARQRARHVGLRALRPRASTACGNRCSPRPVPDTRRAAPALPGRAPDPVGRAASKQRWPSPLAKKMRAAALSIVRVVVSCIRSLLVDCDGRSRVPLDVRTLNDSYGVLPNPRGILKAS